MHPSRCTTCRLEWRTFACLPKDKTLSAWDGWNRCLKSACFCPGLRWSVGRHGLLRSRYTHSRHQRSHWQSVLRRIACEPSADESGDVVLVVRASRGSCCVIGITSGGNFFFPVQQSCGILPPWKSQEISRFQSGWVVNRDNASAIYAPWNRICSLSWGPIGDRKSSPGNPLPERLKLIFE